MKKSKLLITLFLLLGVLSGCGTNKKQDDKKYETTFTNMIEKNSEIVNTYISGDTVIFEYVTPGLDSSKSEIVSYSLKDDKVLGTLTLNDGIYKIMTIEDNSFYVVDLDKGEYTLYNSNCEKINNNKISDNTISVINLSSDKAYFLYQDINDSKIYKYNINSKKLVELQNENEWLQDIYTNKTNSYFIGNNIIKYNSNDEELEKIENKVNPQIVNENYIFGIKSSYLTMYSFSSKNYKMIKLNNDSENIKDAEGNLLVTVDESNNIYIYDFDKMKILKGQETNNVISLKIINDNQILIVTNNKKLEYKIVDFNNYESLTDFVLEDYKENTINGYIDLPDYTGSDTTISLTKKIEEEYGVRILYGDDIFNISSLGYNFTKVSEETAYYYMSLIYAYLDYYPKGLLKEAGLGNPVIIYLCSDLGPGGVNLYDNGYNLIYVTVGGNDDFFLSTLTHEIGHALEHKISGDLLQGWVDMMPREALEAYGDGIEGITVEFTKDDKGKTPVWFYDVYGRQNEKEDRATIFAGMYNSYVDSDLGLFKYDGLKKKANYWSYMLRQTYDSCKNIDEFKWEKIINN